MTQQASFKETIEVPFPDARVDGVLFALRELLLSSWASWHRVLQVRLPADQFFYLWDDVSRREHLHMVPDCDTGGSFSLFTPFGRVFVKALREGPGTAVLEKLP